MFVVVMLAIVAPAVQGLTIAQYLSGQATVYSLLRQAGLVETLSRDGQYTVFVPSDTYLLQYLSHKGMSLSQLTADTEGFKNLLFYHVVNGTYSLDDLYNEEKLTALNGGTIRVNRYSNGRLLFQGVPLQSRDRVASNGLIHYIYSVMDPANGTVADIVAHDPDLSTLYNAANTAGLLEFLADQDPITLFAPTNAAFAALGNTVQTLLAKPDLLKQILSYHVVPGTLYTAGIHPADLHTFEEADKLHVAGQTGSSFTVDSGHVMRNGQDLSAINGVVHKIDHVLVPQSLKSQL